MSLQLHSAATPAPISKRQKLASVTGFDKPWRNASMFGYTILILFFGIFGIWSAIAPLASGVIAKGNLRVDSEHKIVQHLEGGIVKDILVKEGDRVEAGQVLFRMDALRAETTNDITGRRYFTALAEQARWLAERDGLAEIEFPQDLLNQVHDPEVAKLIETTQALHASRLEILARQFRLRNERISQSHTEITALKARDQTIRKQLVLIEQELQGVEEMFRKGLERKQRLLGLQRAQTGLQGQLEESAARISRAYQRIHEQELQKETMREQFRNRALDQLRSVTHRVNDLHERLSVARDQLRRVEVVAPRSGQVLTLAVHTPGAVVSPGMPMAQIVPEDDNLIIHAKIRSRDIDSVKVGSPAKVRLSAFNPRITPPIDGTLVAVSADVTEKLGGKSFFRATVQLDQASLDRHLKGQKLLSGMDANVIIAVGERTLLSYILTPLIASFELALREP